MIRGGRLVGAAVAALLVITGATPVAASGSGVQVRLAHPKVVDLHPAAAGSPDDPIVTAAVELAGGSEDAPRALHPDGTWVYVVLPELHDSRGLLRSVSVRDSRKVPVVHTEVALSPGLVPSDVLVDAAGSRLYLGSGTHTLVLDLSRPGAPVAYGRIADVMIANHHDIELETIADPVFGLRTFLSVTARWREVDGCTTGTLHVLDISGRLQDAPIEIAEIDMPGATGSPDGCVTPHLRIDAQDRRLDVQWRPREDAAPVAVDSVPYDITSQFQAQALVCQLVRL